MKKIYYTTKDESYPNGILTGYRYITVYQIIFNQPKIIGRIETIHDEDMDIQEIQHYLDEQGFDDLMFKFIKL